MNIITFFSILSPKHKSFYLILIFFSLITVFLEVLSIALVIPFISLILAPDKTIEKLNQFFSNNQIDVSYFDLSNLDNAKYLLIIIFFLIYFFKNIFILYTKYLELKFFKDVEIDISIKVLNSYFLQKYSFFVENNPSILISRLTHDMIVLIGSFVRPTIVILTEALIIISFSIIIFYLNLFKIALIFFVIFIIGGVILKMTISNNKKWGQERMFYDQKRINTLKSFFQNIVFVILDNQFVSIKKYYKEIVEKLTNLKKKIRFYINITKICFRNFRNIFYLYNNNLSINKFL